MTAVIGPVHYLAPLLAPRSVAVIGASERPDSLGRVVYENLLAGGFEGELFAVNPNHTRVLGKPSYASLAAIGRRVDLGVFCAPPSVIPGILGGARDRLRAAAILSGFRSASRTVERRWRHEVSEAARAASVRLLGPQTFGVIRTSLGLNASYCAVAALPGRLTLISQSGAIAMALLDFARTAGIGFASVVALGARGDVDASELLEFALADPETDGILLYLESVSDARHFMSALRAAARTKPVVVLKSARTEAAAESGAPSADRVFDAALRRAGTLRVDTYTQLFSAARVLAAGRVPRGNRLVILTNGRGPGLLAADRAIEAGVALASLTRETKGALERLLPAGSRLDNPVDLRGEAPPQRFAAALEAVLADANVDAGVILHVATPGAPPTDTARAIASVAKDATKPLFAAWLGAVNRPEAAHALEAGGLANFFTPENAVEAFSFMVAYGRNQQLLLEVPPPQTESRRPDIETAERIYVRVREGRSKLLRGRDARSLLAAFGISVAPSAASRRAAAPAHLMVDVGVYRDGVFGPVITLGVSHTTGEQEVALPPLNRKLAMDLVASACGPLRPSEREALVSLLLSVSTLVCVLPWMTELHLEEVATRQARARARHARVTIDLERGPGVHAYRHMAIHPYPAELETTVAVKGGRFRVRPIRPEDAAAERAFVATLSDETRYRRFMHHVHELTPQMLARFTQVDYDREMALVALQGSPRAEKIVAVARYVANPDAQSAEFAVVVGDALQGRGLGPALMRRLIASARRRGFRRLVGGVLARNAPMLAMVGKLGFEARPDPEDREQMIVTLELAGARAAPAPPRQPKRRA